jgi:hypothetical protein
LKVKPDGSVAQEWTITSESGQTPAVTSARVGSMVARRFYGWNVVAAVFVMAMLSVGLGFYGVTLGGVVIVPALLWLIGRLRACPGMESGFGQQPGLGSATSDSGRSGR